MNDLDDTKNMTAQEKLLEALRIEIAQAETALIQFAKQEVKDAGKYIHDNRWNWR